MARHIAKTIVAAELADQCEVQLAYAIGVADPVSVMVDTVRNGPGRRRKAGRHRARDTFPLTPKEIIDYLDLRRPIFKATSAYGHFGREEDGFTWEHTDKAEVLKFEAGVTAAKA